MDIDVSGDVNLIRTVKRREGTGLDKETSLIASSLYKIETNEIQYKSTSKGWIDTLNPYYRAFNGDIPLTPDVFEVLSIPSSYEVFSKEDLETLESLDYCNDFGWRIEDLRDGILKSDYEADLSMLTGDPNDNGKEIHGLREYSLISISSDLSVNYIEEKMSKIIYEDLYRTLYNTLNIPINWDKIISYKMLLPKEYELLNSKITGSPSRFTLSEIYNTEGAINDILSGLFDYGKIRNLLMIACVYKSNDYLFEFDKEIVGYNSVELLLGTGLVGVEVPVDDKNLGQILLLSTLIEKDINKKRRIYDYVLLNYGTNVLNFNEGIKNNYKQFISPSVVVANVSNNSRIGFKYQRKR